MAIIRVINNHTGDEAQVDETWLERWPEDFRLYGEDPPPVLDPPAPEAPPLDGTPEKEF